MRSETNNQPQTGQVKTGLIKLEESGITDAYECINLVILRCSQKIVYRWIANTKLL